MMWCRRWDSNPHEINSHWILSPACLPVPPLRHGRDSERVCGDDRIARELSGSRPGLRVLRALTRAAGFPKIGPCPGL